MDYRRFVSDLPAAQSVSFESVDECEEALARLGVKQPMRQLGKEPFQASMAAGTYDEAVLAADRYSTRLTMHIAPPPGQVGLLFPRSASDQFLAHGQQVHDGDLIVVASDTGIDATVGPLSGSEAVSIPHSRFVSMAEVLCPTSELHAIQTTSIIPRNGRPPDALRRAIVKQLADPASDPSHERFTNLIAETLAWMDEATGGWREVRMLSWARVRVAKEAQAFIEEHHRGPIRIEDVCRATGVGIRTVQRCFREHFGITVSEYLKTVRLDAARRELVVSHRSEDSVTAIALRNGITHLGRFSLEFRERFGRSPREILSARP